MQYKVERNTTMISSLNVHNIDNQIQAKGRRRKRKQVVRHLFLIIGDGVFLGILLLSAIIIFHSIHLELSISGHILGAWDVKLFWGFLGLLSWYLAARVTQAYHSLSASNPFRSVLKVLSTLALVFIFWTILTLPLFAQDIGSYMKLVAAFFVITVFTLTIWRIIFAEVISSPRFRLRAVIVGTTATGQAVARELQRARRPYATLLGYISEETDLQLQENRLSILGGREVLKHLVQSEAIDMIITALDHNESPRLFQEAIEMAQYGISVVPMAIAYESASGKTPIESMGDQWYLVLPLESMTSPLYLCWRTIMDFAFGLVGTIMLLLLLPLLALLIYIDSPGPIFYCQKRLGFQGKPFTLYKFRSMRTDAEVAGQAVWATDHDPRVTNVGHFLRSTHLDELPQVVSILRGEMSLIGPRPERATFVAALEKTVPFYRYRLMVKPGLTGWAQVKYRYTNTQQEALVKMQHDLYYIKHQSFTLDVFIILMTVIEVLLKRGV